jgi:hypothetical protein
MLQGLSRNLFSKFKCYTPQLTEESEGETTIKQQGLTKNISLANTTSADTLLLWATKAESLLYTQKQLSERNIYTIYRIPFVKEPKADKIFTQLQDFHKLLSVAEQNQNNFNIYCIPSRMNIIPKTSLNKKILIHESLDQFNQQDLLNSTWFFRTKKSYTSKPETTQARISICSSSKSYKQLIDILSNLMHLDHELNKIILQAKILGPGERHLSIETAILYLNHEELNKESLRKLQQILQPLDDGYGKIIPFGMHPFTSCAGYGEQSFESQDNGYSFGYLRSNIIFSAIANRCINPKMSLAETLKKECSNNDLDLSHPAFCSGNYDKLHI